MTFVHPYRLLGMECTILSSFLSQYGLIVISKSMSIKQ